MTDRNDLDIYSKGEYPADVLSNFYPNAFSFDGHRFANIRWKLTGTLYWKGKPIKRSSDAYQRFLDEAYSALCSNRNFRDALLASTGRELTHTIGKSDSKRTVLTEYEFVTRLNRCRQLLIDGKTEKAR